jgi:putative ABC transport system permease protein
VTILTAMNGLADFRIALRSLLRSKGFALSAALTLALGIAATTTIFSVVYGVLLRPLPYADANRIVLIQGEKQFSTGPRIMNYSPSELEDFAGATRGFSSIAMSGVVSFTIRTDAGVEPLSGATVSRDFFPTLGTAPLLGRHLAGEVAPNVVISERLWRTHFAAAAAVLGKPLTIADRENIVRTYTVVGVLPREFQYPHARTDVWRTLEFTRSIDERNVSNRNAGGYFFVARLRDGVSLEQARQDAARAIDVLKPHFNPSREDMRSVVVTMPAHISGAIGPALWILLGAVGLVLLVACANVANLILARQASRTKEVSLRLALGAPRGRLMTYLLAESTLIGVAGGTIGVLISFGAIRLLQWIQPAQLPRLDAVAVDLPVLMFAAAVAVVTSLAAGCGPAVLATKTDALLVMRSGSRGSTGTMARRARSALVVTEIAISIVLLVGAGLLARSLAALLDTDLGVNTENVMTAQLDLALGRTVTAGRQIEIAEGLAARVRSIPSVSSVGFGTGLPPAGEYMRVSFVLRNAANDGTEAHMVTSVPASPGYFDSLQIRLLKGRLFTDADSATAPLSVILNREGAKRFFGDEDPIGRTLPFGKQQLTVVGVVENVRYTGVAGPNESAIYRPFGQSPFRLVTLVARTSGDPDRIAAELRQVIRTYDPDISIGLIQPLSGWVSSAVAQPRFRALMLSAVAAITLLLAMVGLYGVIAYSTAQRTAEIGVRMAIGAQRSDVVRMVLGEGTRLAVAGVVIGMIAAYWSARLLTTFLYGVSTTDLAAFGGSAIGLFVVALVATYVPAARAARVDPAVALRAE